MSGAEVSDTRNENKSIQARKVEGFELTSMSRTITRMNASSTKTVSSKELLQAINAVLPTRIEKGDNLSPVITLQACITADYHM